MDYLEIEKKLEDENITRRKKLVYEWIKIGKISYYTFSKLISRDIFEEIK